MASSKIICILSPPRSGSSLTTRIINILGVHMGASQDFDKPNKHNPNGFWEHHGIQEINCEILSWLGYDALHHGANWTKPAEFPDNWEMNPQLSDLKERARQLIQKDFAKHDLWGWKDPRTCFTLPFWQCVLPQIEYVILVRNPVDVARSLERFICEDCSFERGLNMWTLHINYAFKYTAGQNRIVVNVEDWMNDWENELGCLANFFGKPELANNTDIRTAVHALIDKSLWHGTSTCAISTVNKLYKQLSTQGMPLEKENFSISPDTLEFLDTEAQNSDAIKTVQAKNLWEKQLTHIIDELSGLIPHDGNLVLVENNQIGTDVIKGRNVKPFMERNGEFCGCPSDDAEAIEEFKRLHTAGAEYIAFAWPAFWWLDYFPEFQQYLRSKFRCILQNDQLVVFDLRS